MEEHVLDWRSFWRLESLETALETFQLCWYVPHKVCLDNWQESFAFSSVLVYFAAVLDILRCVLRPKLLLKTLSFINRQLYLRPPLLKNPVWTPIKKLGIYSYPYSDILVSSRRHLEGLRCKLSLERNCITSLCCRETFNANTISILYWMLVAIVICSLITNDKSTKHKTVYMQLSP